MAGIKIVDLPALGRDLLSTDLLEMSIGGTASRKITGQEIMNASKLNVGSTPIVSGTVGRVLFQGTGDVLQQSGNLFWDATNNRLGIGTSAPSNPLEVSSTSLGFGNTVASFASSIQDVGIGIASSNASAQTSIRFFHPTNSYRIWMYGGSNLAFVNTYNGSVPQFTMFGSGNLGIGTGTTDAGFKLDVNGTARVLGNVDFGNTSSVASLLTVSIPFSVSAATDLLRLRGLASKISIVFGAGGVQSASLGSLNLGNSYFESGLFFNTASGGVVYEAMRIANTRNVLINTTTDDGFKLDVNGTARVQGLLTLTNNIEFTSFNRTIANASFPLSSISTNQVRSLNDLYDSGGTNGFTFYNNVGTIRGRIYATGNWFIGSSPTDAGFKLDVNGSARVTTLRSDNPVIGFAPSTAGVLIGSNQTYRIVCDGSSYYDFRTSVGAIYRLRDDGSTSFGSTTIAASAMVDIQSTTKGFLPPRMTNAQRTAIVSPAVGLIVYCTDVTEGLWVYKSTGWTFIV